MSFDQVLRKYFKHGRWTITEGLSGWNNTTRFVETEEARWVLRIYETHQDEAKIRYEHEILLVLNEQPLPFQVPMPVRCLDGGTIVRLEDGSGRLACLFTYIEGQRPDEGSLGIGYAFGVVTGQLSKALANVKVVSLPLYPPYYEMDSSHPLCTSERVTAFCSAPPVEFIEVAEDLQAISSAILSFRALLPQFRTLPHQLIHGDINHSNSLVASADSNRLAAILDFEFCTRDLRVMEIAVMISGFLNSNDVMAKIERYLQGVGEQLRLDRSEIEAIPSLVRLRNLDVFLHFLGRYWDGVDDQKVLLEQSRSVHDGLSELERIESELSQLCSRYLTT
ncbi:phosphotransferase [Cohnella mopanensis]|uniref:phosphotransferase n=1 Tax=Cohnella mopanensis TaxID=2911966 RepID=UPI001EF8DB3C|nr:phosphotransferase [Cohnella mopanensis]